MSRFLLFCLILVSLFSCTKEEAYKVMTYNIRYDNPNDGENQWSKRKNLLNKQILLNAPDVLGIQEGLHHQVKFLDSVLIDYNYVGVGRDDGKAKGEYSAIFFNKNKLEVINQGTFWLSETPHKISVGWDASMERICTYGLFKDKKSNQQFFVFNTHFDHIGNEARLKSAKLILEKIKTLNTKGYPVIVMGDFNLLPESEPIQHLTKVLKDARTYSATPPIGPNGTYNGFKTDARLDRRIDYIFVSQNNVIVNNYNVIGDKIEGKYLSDHLPVIAKVKFAN